MNGIIINNELHELVSLKTTSPCGNCSLREICDCVDEILLCDVIARCRNEEEYFVNRGNAKEFIITNQI